MGDEGSDLVSKPALTTLWINYTSQASPISTETAALVAALRKKIDDLELELGRLKAARSAESR